VLVGASTGSVQVMVGVSTGCVSVEGGGDLIIGMYSVYY